VLVELKATGGLTGVDEAQLLNQLKATGNQRGLLLNFGAPSLEYKRRVFNLRESAQSADTDSSNLRESAQSADTDSSNLRESAQSADSFNQNDPNHN
jgi:hypothetical protein